MENEVKLALENIIDDITEKYDTSLSVMSVYDDYHMNCRGFFVYEIMEDLFLNEAILTVENTSDTPDLLDELYNAINRIEDLDWNDWDMHEQWGYETGADHDTVLVYWR